MATIAQDLIVTTTGDSIHCKIKGSDRNGVFFRQLQPSGVVSRYLQHTQIANTERGHFETSYLGDQRLKDLRSRNYFRVAIFGGIGYNWFPDDDQQPDWMQEHTDELRFGILKGIEIHFLPSDQWSIGGNYRNMSVSHTTSDVMYYFLDGSVMRGIMKDDINVHSFGFLISYGSAPKDAGFYWRISGGLEHFRYINQATYLIPIDLGGTTVGASLGISGEYKFNHGIGIGLSADRHFAVLHNLYLEGDRSTFDIMGSGTAISLHRWDLALVIGYTY